MHVVLVGPEFEENLSLRYLAAALRQSGHRAGLARFDSLEYVEGVVEHVMREKPGIVGLSMVFQVRAREFFELARALRKAGYAGHITAGGHFATFAYANILREIPEIDTIVRQEGEQTLVELADALENSAEERTLDEIAGLVTRRSDGNLSVAPRRQQVGDLDSLAFPIREAASERHLGVPTAYLVGSRGCYADCDYCSIFAWHEAALGKRYRMRSVANIADEMAALYQTRGVRFFVFHDDNFFLPTAAGNRKRFEGLRSEMTTRSLSDIGLMLKLRPNDCDRDNVHLLKEMGLLRVFVGIENASQRQIRSLGRDSTVEDVTSCLNLLRELDIYATFNILLFDPYTTLDDIAENLRFLRDHTFFPFNWCKVEPYAGTSLERRYAAEGRLQGDYLGYDYRMDDPRTRLMYDLLLPAFYYRNFDYYGLANLNIGMGYHRQLLKQFYPDRCAPALCENVQELIETINTDALDLLERTHDFVRDVPLDDRGGIARFGEELKRDSFRAQHALGRRVEATMREIERAAGVRREEQAGPVGISEAFTPLLPLPETESEKPRLSVTRRGLLATLGSAAVSLMAACGRRRPIVPATLPVAPVTPPVAPTSSVAPHAVIRIAPGHPETVHPPERFTLEAALLPTDALVLGEPRLVCRGGKIDEVKALPGNHLLTITYLPGGGSTDFDPNASITVAWTVRGKETDTVVMARAFVHVDEDGRYAFGYETPRPTIAEMAPPPIGLGPKP